MSLPRCAILMAAACLPCAHAAAQNNVLVSVSSAGAPANNDSYYSLVSADGRYVVYQSEASNLVPNDANGAYDIFRSDLQTGVTELVSVSTSGLAGNGLGLSPALSGDGRFVVWQSNAANLIVGDTNATWDVFLRDMDAGVTTRLSLTAAGAQALLRSDSPRITPDARFVTFESDADLVPADTNLIKDCYRLDRTSGQLELVSTSSTGALGNGISYHAQPSDDGRHVVFFSSATNLVPGDTNGWGDVFRKDMLTGTLLRVNVSSAGAQANGESIWPSISGDGQTISFCSRASNLVAGDTNGQWDIFAHVLPSGVTLRLNLQPNGQQADSYVRSPSALSGDGRLIIFASLSTNLVPGDTNGFQDVFLRDRVAQVTRRVNLAHDGSQADDDSFVPHMTPDASVVTLTSEASNLVASDPNGLRDIFATELSGPIGTAYCAVAVPNSTGVPGAIAAEGSTLVAANDVTLTASDLPPGEFGYFLVSMTQAVFNPPGSAGFLCLGGAIGRYNASVGVGPAFSLELDLAAVPTPTGTVAVSPGESWNFQAWYRDVGNTNNFTDAVSIDFD